MIILGCCSCTLQAQRIQTIVPGQPVIVGNAFLVQYIITSPEDLVSIETPGFNHFKLVSGPHEYRGQLMVNGTLLPVKNITYTLVPTGRGAQMISGLVVRFKNKVEQKSSDQWIHVLPAQKASFTARSSFTDASLYVPKSTTDLKQLITGNLFVKTEVSRKECFTGEPVMVTFTLYSRLQSTSEVINSPSLYGCSVMDMLDINEAHLAVDTLKGKIFNTAVLRKLLLYPSVSGKLVIDPMQLTNKVEFGDSSANGNRRSIDTVLSSPSVILTVKPLPKGRPENFSGAVGYFTMKAVMTDSMYSTGKQGHLVVSISGSGNFLQFSPPTIQWPHTFDVFEPQVTDHIDKNSVPTKGMRQYHFIFTTDSAGHFHLAPISFSFFDPLSGKFRKLITPSYEVDVQQSPYHIHISPPPGKMRSPISWLRFMVVLLVISGAVILGFSIARSKAHRQKNISGDLLIELEAMDTSRFTERQVYNGIQKILDRILLHYPQRSQKYAQEISQIREDCQILFYATTQRENKKEDVKKRTVVLLGKIMGNHSAYL